METRISVIIPVLNEEGTIGRCLDQFRDTRGVEVIVVDGGSTDRTREVTAGHGFVRWIVSSHTGRAPQMNLGAGTATGEVLLFLHSDTVLPGRAIPMILLSLEDPEVVGGRFRLGLSEETGAFRWIAALSTLRSRYLGITYGDQAIYVRRKAFEDVGGFPPLQLFEDSEFCTALARTGRFVMLDAAARSSTRRWRRWGIARTVAWMWALRLLYSLGVSDRRLVRWYR
jgi:rSAM/selenodomain-associated transferase 2